MLGAGAGFCLRRIAQPSVPVSIREAAWDRTASRARERRQRHHRQQAALWWQTGKPLSTRCRPTECMSRPAPGNRIAGLVRQEAHGHAGADATSHRLWVVGRAHQHARRCTVGLGSTRRRAPLCMMSGCPSSCQLSPRTVADLCCEQELLRGDLGHRCTRPAPAAGSLSQSQECSALVNNGGYAAASPSSPGPAPPLIPPPCLSTRRRLGRLGVGSTAFGACARPGPGPSITVLSAAGKASLFDCSPAARMNLPIPLRWCQWKARSGLASGGG